jgi:hypothetical protein
MCSKPRKYKKDYKSKGVGTSKDLDMTQLTEGKSTEGKKGDVYLALRSTQTK